MTLPCLCSGREIKNAISHLVDPNERDAFAVQTRTEIDLRIGAAFTRFQTLRLRDRFQNLPKMLSYGELLVFFMDDDMPMGVFFWTSLVSLLLSLLAFSPFGGVSPAYWNCKPQGLVSSPLWVLWLSDTGGSKPFNPRGFGRSSWS